MATCVLALAIAGGCYLSHERPSHRDDAGDHSATTDAGARDGGTRDAGTDAGRCGPVDRMLAEDPYRLFGARDDGELTLVVGSKELDEPITLWEVRDDGPSIRRFYTIPDSVAGEPATVARSGSRVAVAFSFRTGDRPQELAVIDLERAEVVARGPFDPLLPSTYLIHATIQMSSDALLVLHRTAEGEGRARVLDAESLEVHFTDDVPDIRIDDAARLAETHPLVGRVVDQAMGRVVRVAAADRHWDDLDYDGSSVAGLDARGLWVNGRLRAERGTDLPSWGARYGFMSHSSPGVVAVATDTGLHWGYLDGAEMVFGRPDTRFLGAYPVAYAAERHRGVFFIDPALGREPAELRYVGACLP